MNRTELLVFASSCARAPGQPEQPGDVKRTFADIGLARAELGFEPRTNLAAGLAAFVAWLRHAETGPSAIKDCP